MPRRYVIPETTLVESQDQLDQLCAECRALERFAFDTEFVMEDRYAAELCLVQVATEQSVALIDPYLNLDLNALWNLIHDDQVETVVHAGQEDLGIVVQQTGRVPRAIFDVQIGAGLVGPDYPLSLQKLVQAVLHVRLHKSKTLTDWRRRPLSPDQLRYAAEDVAYLLPVHAKLTAQLGRLGRTAWAREEFARFESATIYKREVEERIRKIKGIGALRGKALNIARALFDWRDEVAKKYNRPARILLKDHLLVEIARQELATKTEIRHLRGINLSDRDVHALGAVVADAAALPAGASAEPARTEETPGETALVALITAVLRGYCLDQNLAYGLVASKRSIQELIRHRMNGTSAAPQGPIELLRGWRGSAVGVMLDEVLAGQRAIRVTLHNGEAHVRLDPIDRKPTKRKDRTAGEPGASAPD